MKNNIEIHVAKQEFKDKLLEQSKYIHDYFYLDKDGISHFLDVEKASTLMHLYMLPDLIIVKDKDE